MKLVEYLRKAGVRAAVHVKKPMLAMNIGMTGKGN